MKKKKEDKKVDKLHEWLTVKNGWLDGVDYFKTDQKLSWEERLIILILAAGIALVGILVFFDIADAAQFDPDKYRDKLRVYAQTSFGEKPETQGTLPQDPWATKEWIGRYVMIQSVQETDRGPSGTLVGTGNELPNTLNFLTLNTVTKERGVFVRLAGRKDEKNNIYVGDFNEHCTANGFKLALAVRELKIKINDIEYLAISNFIITWEAIQITWRSQFTWAEIEPLLKKAFIDSGYGPPNE